jgi:hypothetical protein
MREAADGGDGQRAVKRVGVPGFFLALGSSEDRTSTPD